jgi:uncharacterized protein
MLRAMRAPPPEPVRLPVMLQRWEDVTFLHWRYPLEALRPLVHSGLSIDVHDGSAWVGIVLFRMRVAPSLTPAVLDLVTIPEFNVRTYVTGPDGRPAVWFMSLDVASRAVAIAARGAYRLPYHAADMRVETDGTRIAYRCRRRNAWRPAQLSLAVTTGRLVAARSLRHLDHFLTARYAVDTSAGPLLLRAPIEHRPWPLRRAQLVALEQTLTDAAGLPPPAEAPLVHGADPVTVRTGAIRPLW